MNKIKFLQGPKDDLYIKNADGTVSNDLKSFEEGSFLLTTNIYNLYYVSENNTLIKLISDPSNTIKEIHTYYYLEKNPINPPTTPTIFPPDETKWSLITPNYTEGDIFYKINCIVYISGDYEYKNLDRLLGYEDIDAIVIEDFGTSLLGQGKIGFVKLNNF